MFDFLKNFIFGPSLSGGFDMGKLGTIAELGSVFFEGLGKQQDYAGEIAASQFNARVAKQNIGISRSQTEAAVKQQRRENYIRAGANRAAAGASGLGMSSAADVLADNAAQDELSILNLQYSGRLEQKGYENDYLLDTMRADSYSRAASLSKGATLLKGYSTFAGTVLK